MALDGGAPHRTWKPTIAAGAWLLCTSWAATARAAPFDLTWNAPEGCPSREEMVTATRERLGESETTASPELFVRGTVVPERDAFVVAFLVKDTSGADVGERKVRVQGRACRAIEEPAALVLATMISVVRPRSEAPAVPPPVSAPADGPPPAAGSQAQVSAVPTGGARPPSSSSASTAADAAGRGGAAPPPRITLGVAGVGSVGVVPQRGLGVALRTTYSPHSRLLLGLETSYEDGAQVRTGRGAVGFGVLTASLSAGIQVLGRGPIEIAPLVTVRGGVLRTVPSGFQLVKRQAHPLALAGVGAVVRAWLAPHFYAEALPQAEFVLIRDVFEATEGRTIYFLHQPSAVGARLSVGVGYEFP